MLPAFRAAFEVLRGLRLLPPGGLYCSMMSFFRCWRVVVLPVFLMPGGIVVVVFLTPVVASSLVVFLMPGVASPLSSSSCPVWDHRCCLPHTRRGILACRLPHSRGGISVVVFLTPVVASSLVIFLMPGMASPLTSSSCLEWHLHCRLPHACRGIVACRLPHARRGISVDECQNPASTTPCSSTANVDFVLRSWCSYSHFRCTHTSSLLTCLAGVRCPRGICHARRALRRVCTHTLCLVLSSSHTLCMGSLFPRYPSRLVCSSSRLCSHALRDLVIFLSPIVVSSLVVFLMPSVVSPLTSPSCLGWHRRCRLPPAQYGVQGVLPFRSLRLSVCVTVFHSAWHGLRYARWSSVPLWHGIRGGVLLCLAWRSVCVAVFRSARCSIRGRVPLWLAQPLVCVVVFHSSQCSIRGGVSFCPAPHTQWCSVLSGVAFDMRGGPLFCLARHTWQGSFLSGAAVGMCGSLPFCSAQHTRRCSILSGAARCALRCCGFVISGPGLLIAVPDDPVVIGASDPRSRRWSRYAAQRCGKVPRTRCIDNRISMSFVVGDPGSLRRAAGLPDGHRRE